MVDPIYALADRMRRLFPNVRLTMNPGPDGGEAVLLDGWVWIRTEKRMVATLGALLPVTHYIVEEEVVYPGGRHHPDETDTVEMLATRVESAAISCALSRIYRNEVENTLRSDAEAAL